MWCWGNYLITYGSGCLLYSERAALSQITVLELYLSEDACVVCSMQSESAVIPGAFGITLTYYELGHHETQALALERSLQTDHL